MKIKGFRTIIVAIAAAVFGALEAFDYTQVLTGDNAGFVITGLGVLFAWLRKITKTALGQSS